MNQKNQNRNGAIALAIIAIMILGGGVTLVSSYVAARSKSISIWIFAIVWIVMLLVAMLRIVLNMIKSKREALDDMQHYEHQEEATLQNAMPVPKAKKKMYIKRIVISIVMMVLSSFVVVPVLIASHSFVVVLIVCLWYYGRLVRDIVLNVKMLKNAEDDPTDHLQQIVQGDAESSAMHLQRNMAVCPYCGGKFPEGFVNCCHCGRKL